MPDIVSQDNMLEEDKSPKTFIGTCPHCKKTFEAEYAWLGMEAQCPNCQQDIVIAEPSTEDNIPEKVECWCCHGKPHEKDNRECPLCNDCRFIEPRKIREMIRFEKYNEDLFLRENLIRDELMDAHDAFWFRHDIGLGSADAINSENLHEIGLYNYRQKIVVDYIRCALLMLKNKKNLYCPIDKQNLMEDMSKEDIELKWLTYTERMYNDFDAIFEFMGEWLNTRSDFLMKKLIQSEERLIEDVEYISAGYESKCNNNELSEAEKKQIESEIIWALKEQQARKSSKTQTSTTQTDEDGEKLEKKTSRDFCSDCHDTGIIIDSYECDKCHGTGHRTSGNCSACSGRGTIYLKRPCKNSPCIERRKILTQIDLLAQRRLGYPIEAICVMLFGFIPLIIPWFVEDSFSKKIETFVFVIQYPLAWLLLLVFIPLGLFIFPGKLYQKYCCKIKELQCQLHDIEKNR